MTATPTAPTAPTAAQTLSVPAVWVATPGTEGDRLYTRLANLPAAEVESLPSAQRHDFGAFVHSVNQNQDNPAGLRFARAALLIVDTARWQAQTADADATAALEAGRLRRVNDALTIAYETEGACAVSNRVVGVFAALVATLFVALCLVGALVQSSRPVHLWDTTPAPSGGLVYRMPGETAFSPQGELK